MKVKWWQRKWVVRIDGGCRFAEFGPYRFKFVAEWMASTLPGPLETATVNRIVESWVAPGRERIPSGTIFTKVPVPVDKETSPGA